MKKLCNISIKLLIEEVNHCINEDKNSPGGWNYFTLSTIDKLTKDYDITMQYFKQMTKEQFDFVGEAFDLIVYPFQKIEMVELLENLYLKFYDNNINTDFYHDNIENLRQCIKDLNK